MWRGILLFYFICIFIFPHNSFLWTPFTVSPPDLLQRHLDCRKHQVTPHNWCCPGVGIRYRLADLPCWHSGRPTTASVFPGKNFQGVSISFKFRNRFAGVNSTKINGRRSQHQTINVFHTSECTLALPCRCHQFNALPETGANVAGEVMNR